MGKTSTKSQPRSNCGWTSSRSACRTQEQNREAARERLVALLHEALNPPRKRKKSRVNRVGKVKRLKAKKVRGDVKAKRGKVDW